MNKTIILALLAFVSFTACKNQSDKQGETEIKIENTPDSTNDVKPETEPHGHIHSQVNAHAHDYLYKSDNGEIVDVTFYEENNKMYAKVKRDGKETLVLDQTTAWSKGAEYEKGDYKWISKTNDATFSDGTETMNLVVISPLQYTFTNDKEDIIIIYFSKNDKRFVTIKKDNETSITLEQTTAWAKGAEYGKDAIKWRGDGTKGVLIEDGVESQYIQKNQ